MIFINPTFFPTARNLRQAYLERYGVKHLITSKPNKAKNIIIRYGTSVNIPYSEDKLLFNSLELIRFCSNKANHSHFNKTPIVKFIHYDSFPDFPLVCRNTLTGFHGKGIIIVNSEEEFEQYKTSHPYHTKLLYPNHEFRILVFNNKIIKLFKKIPENNEIRIKNNANSHFSLRSDYSKFPKLLEMLETFYREFNNILNVQNYLIGLDVIRYNGKYYILEINSSPGLSLPTARVVINNLEE